MTDASLPEDGRIALERFMKDVRSLLEQDEDLVRLGWRLLEGPYEVAGIQRLVLIHDRLPLGIDGFTTIDGDERIRLWTQLAAGAEVTELDELPASSVTPAGVVASVDSAALEITAGFSVSGSNATKEESLAKLEPLDTTVSYLATLLVSLTSTPTWAESLLRRSGTPSSYSNSLVDLVKAFETLGRAAEEQEPVVLLDQAARFLVSSAMTSDSGLLAASSGHDLLRRLATYPGPLSSVLDNEIVRQSETTRSLQVLVERMAHGDLLQGVKIFRRFGRWMERNAPLVDSMVIPALGDESWVMDRIESSLYLDLAQGLLSLRNLPHLGFVESSNVEVVLTRALFLYSSVDNSTANVVLASDELLEEFRSRIDRLTVSRQLRGVDEMSHLGDDIHRDRVRYARLRRQRRFELGYAEDSLDYRELRGQLRVLAWNVAHRLVQGRISNDRAQAGVRNALTQDALTRYGALRADIT